MNHTKNRLAALIVISLLLITVACQNVYSKETIGAIEKEEKGISLESIDELFTMVKNEYVDNVSYVTLINGSIKAIKEYLKRQKLNGSFLSELPGNLNKKDEIEKFNKIYQEVMKKYPSISNEKLSYIAIRGMLRSLKDPYSVFLDPKEYASLMEQMKGGSFGGIGIYIELDKKKNNQLTVVEAIEGTPGFKAGLKTKDRIICVDGKSTKGMVISDAQKLLRGKVGSKVILTIERTGVNKPFDVEIVRDNIKIKTLTYKMLENEIGYIKLMIFGENTSQEIKDALEDLENKGAKGYILDVRNNGGGYVNAALNVCSEFLDSGSNVVTIIKKGSPDIPYQSSPNLRPRTPMVNIVNEFSASASEITAGAIQDHKIGKILGVKTFGKASVQKIFPLPNGSAIKLTTAHYVTPKRRYINKKGIMPDVVINIKTLESKSDEDKQLSAAINILKEEIKNTESERIKNSAFPDAIHVRTLQDEYDYIKKNFGKESIIIKSKLVFQKNQLFDTVTIKGFNGEEEKTLIFDIQDII